MCTDLGGATNQLVSYGNNVFDECCLVALQQTSNTLPHFYKAKCAFEYGWGYSNMCFSCHACCLLRFKNDETCASCLLLTPTRNIVVPCGSLFLERWGRKRMGKWSTWTSYKAHAAIKAALQIIQVNRLAATRLQTSQTYASRMNSSRSSQRGA